VTPWTDRPGLVALLAEYQSIAEQDYPDEDRRQAATEAYRDSRETVRGLLPAIEREAAAPATEALDVIREILTKLIRQYHGVAHSGGSWLNCDDRWCADLRKVLTDD
jgi:CBS-domain-containing membrane protein